MSQCWLKLCIVRGSVERDVQKQAGFGSWWCLRSLGKLEQNTEVKKVSQSVDRPEKSAHNLVSVLNEIRTRGGAVWQLVGLITRRS